MRFSFIEHAGRTNPMLDASSLTLRVVTGLFLFVAATAVLMSQPPVKGRTAPASKSPSSTGISAKPADASMEGLLIRYEDTRTAGAIFIRDAVAEADAAQWLAQVNQVQDATGLTAVVRTNFSRGLVGARRPFNGVLYVASSPGIDLSGPGRPGTIGTELSDIRMGHAIYHTGGGSQATIEGYLKAAGEATSVTDLAKLVAANHTAGLMGASHYQDLGDSRVRAEAFWSARVK
jgi:hypothetical protein